MLAIIKWLFILSTICLSIYHYRLERAKLNKIAKYITDQKVLSDLKAAARKRMGLFLLLLTTMIVWSISYDIQNDDLSRELEQASANYGNMSASEKRLTQAKAPDPNVIDDIKSYYTDVFVNYYVMRKCNMAQPDDVFIINSAITREIALNNIPLELRDSIIKEAKAAYLKKFANFDCNKLQNKDNQTITNYRNYIQTIREVLRATF